MARSRERGATAPKYDFSEQVGHLLRRAYQRHVAIFQRVVPDSRLTGAQFCVLCALRDHGPVSMSKICRFTAIDQATVRGILERLKARDLVATSADAIDRRKVIVALKPAGDALLDDIMPAAQHISELTTAGLNPAEQLALLFLLRKLSDDDSSEASAEPASDAVQIGDEPLRPARRSDRAARSARARA